MASSDFFVRPMLANIRDRCLLPASEDTLNDLRLLRLLNDELSFYMANVLMGLHEEYLLQRFDVGPIETGGKRFRIPTRAVGSALRDVTVLRGSEEIPAVRLEVDSKPDERSILTGYGYVIEGDDVVFNSAIGTGDTIRFRVAYMPTLVDAEVKGEEIETIAGNRQSFTYAGAPIKPDPVLPGRIDFIRLGGTNQPTGLDSVVTSINTPTRTVTLAAGHTVPPDISVGDWAMAAGTSVIAPIPDALQPLLAQRVAYVALRSVGDEKAEAARIQLGEMQDNAMALLRPRTEAQPRYVINRYAAGWRR